MNHEVNYDYGDSEIVRWLKRIDAGQKDINKRIDSLGSKFVTRTEHSLYRESQQERNEQMRTRMKSIEDETRWVRRTLAAAFVGILAEAAIIVFTLGIG